MARGCRKQHHRELAGYHNVSRCYGVLADVGGGGGGGGDVDLNQYFQSDVALAVESCCHDN